LFAYLIQKVIKSSKRILDMLFIFGSNNRFAYPLPCQTFDLSEVVSGNIIGNLFINTPKARVLRDACFSDLLAFISKSLLRKYIDKNC
jgi:hypothetical protein